MYPLFPEKFAWKLFFFESENCRKSKRVDRVVIFLICNENLNTFLTRLQKLFKGLNYSREETICRHMVHALKKTKERKIIKLFLDFHYFKYKNEPSQFLENSVLECR